MRLISNRLIVALCLTITCRQVFSQSKFFNLVTAAYDSTNNKNYNAALVLLHQAKALKGIDPGYNESVNLYLGNNYEAIGKIDSCFFFFGEAIKYYEDKKDSVSLSYLYNHLASVEIDFTKRYSNAVEYYRKQILYEVVQKDSSSLFHCLNDIGIAFKHLNKYDSALHYFNLVLTSTSANKQIKAKALRLTGDIYSLSGKNDKALIYYNQALRSLSISNDTLELFNTFTNKGDCLLQQKKFTESLFCFEQAQHYMTALITNNHRKDLYHNLAEVYSNTNDFRKAFHYKNLEGNIKDSINTQNIQMAAAEVEAKYETRKNKDSLTISEKNRVIANHKFLATLIGAVFICLVAFLALRNAALRKRANVKLSTQKAKVEALAANLEEANQTKARLFSVISHDLRSPVGSLYASLKMQELKGGKEKANGAVSSHIMHLLDTLEDLLTWSKSQMDRFTLQPITLRIADLYADLIELNYDAAASKQIMILNKTERQVKVYTDENLLKTILRNVLGNSIHHAPDKSTIEVAAAAYEGGVVCTISNEATATDAALLEVQLQTAAIGSSRHGLGNVLIKEFTQKLDADFKVSYADGKVYLQIKVPSMYKQVHALQAVG